MTLGSQGTFTGTSGHFWGKFKVFSGKETKYQKNV